MAISFVGSLTGTWAGATSGNNTISLTALTGGSGAAAAIGDLVVAVYVTGSAADRALTITDGSTNYTLVASELYANSTTDTNLRVAYKMLTAADTTTTFGPTGNAADAGAAAVYVWRGVDGGNILDVAAVTASGTTTGRPTPGAITPTTSGTIVLCLGGSAAPTGATYTFSDLSNTKTATSADNNDAMVGIGSFTWSSGTFTPAQWTGGTTGATDSWAAITMVLRPATNKELTPSVNALVLTGSVPTLEFSAKTASPAVGGCALTGANPTVVTNLPIPIGSPSFVYVGGNSGSDPFSGSAWYNISLTALTGGIDSAAQPGDIVIFIQGCTSGFNSGLGYRTGYTNLYNDSQAGGQGAYLVVDYKVMGATPDTVVQASRNAFGGRPAAAAVQVWRGINTTAVDATLVATKTTATTVVDPPSITPVTPHALVISGGWATAAMAGYSITSPLTKEVKVQSVTSYTGTVIMGAYDDWTTGAAVDPASFGGSAGGLEPTISFSVALRPVAATQLMIKGQAPTVLIPVKIDVPAGEVLCGGTDTANADPYASSVSLLMHMEGADASTVFIDDTRKPITTVGSATISTTQQKFNSASGKFPAVSSYVTVPSSDAFAFGTGDFTCEYWAYIDASFGGTWHTALNVGQYNAGLMMRHEGGSTGFYINNVNYGGMALSAGSWHHVAMSRAGSTIYRAIDGVVTNAGANSVNLTAVGVTLGVSAHAPSSEYLGGYLDEVRITKGVGRYTANYSVPTARFSLALDTSPTVGISYASTPAAGSLALSGQAPVLVTGADAVISVEVGSLVATGQSSTSIVNQRALPDAGSLTLTGQQPSTLLLIALTPAAAALTLTGQTPVASLGVVLTPAVGSLTLAGQTPNAALGIALSPTAGALSFAGTTPVASIGVARLPTVGALTLTGQPLVTALGVSLTPSAGALALAGAPPVASIGVAVTPTTGALSFIGVAPALKYDLVVSPAAGTLALTGQAPTVSIGEVVRPAAGALVLTGFAPSITGVLEVLTPAGTLALTGQAPTVSIGVLAQPSAGTLTLTGQTPAVFREHIVTPAAGTLVLTGQTPIKVADHIVQPSAGALSLSGVAPTAIRDHIASPAAGILALTGQAPIALRDHVVQLTAGALALTGQAPTVFQEHRPAPAVGTLTLTGQTPTKVVDYVVQPSAGALSFVGQAPVTGQSHTISVGAGALVLTGQAPTRIVDHVVQPASGTLALTGQAPTIGISYTISLAAGSLTLTGQYPSIAGAEGVQPPAGTLALTGQAPVAFQEHRSTPAAGSLSFTGQAPIVSIGLIAQPSSGALTLTGQQPIVSQGEVTNPNPAQLTFTGQLPVIQEGLRVLPASGALNLTGAVPSVKVEHLIGVPAGSLQLTGQAPNVSAPGTVDVDPGSLALVGQQPTIKVGMLIGVPAGALALSGAAPALISSLSAGPLAGALSLVGSAPSVVVHYRIEVPAGILSLEGQLTSINMQGESTVFEPSAGALALTGESPVLRVAMLIGVPAGALIPTGKVPPWWSALKLVTDHRFIVRRPKTDFTVELPSRDFVLELPTRDFTVTEVRAVITN